MKIRTKANRITSDRTAADSEQKMRIYSSASIAANRMLAVRASFICYQISLCPS